MIYRVFSIGQIKFKKLKYPLTDNSAIEKTAVCEAFSTKMSKLENHVNIYIFCTVQS